MGKSIRSTIAVSITILLIAVASLSIAAIYFIHNANKALYEINEINSVKQRYAINFRGSAHDRSIYIRDYILRVHDGDNNTDIETKIQELKEFYDDSERKLEAMLADPNIPVDNNDRLYFENIKAVKQEAEGYISYIIANSDDPETFAMAQHTLMHGCRELLFKWVDEINVFIDWQEDKNGAIRNHISSLVSIFYTAIVVLSIVAGIFLVGIAIWLVKTVVPLRTISKALHNIAEGDADLTSKLPVTSKNEIGQVADQFNKFVNSMHGIMLTVRKSIDNLSVNGDKLPASVDMTKSAIININQDLSGIKSQMETQSNGVSDVSVNINKINENISNLNEMIEKQTESVDNSSAAVEELVANVQSVTNTVSKSMLQFDNLTKVSENGFMKVADVQNQVTEISEKSKVMSDANRVINEIAAQTNLLAMNAAIEAAHAGEAGQGFAVVADEIRKLAENSATQSKAISRTLKDLISSIDTVVDSSKDAGTAFEAVRAAVGMVQNLQHEISNAMDEQSAGNTQVGQSFNIIKELNHNVRKGSAEMMRASENIHDMMQNLVKTTHDIIESVQHMSQTTGDIQNVIGSLEQVGTSTAENINAVEREIRRFTL